MPNGVVSWWLFLCTVATVNVAAWSVAAESLKRRQPSMPAQIYAASRMQLMLSGMYVLGCAFRSVLPVYDVPRLCLFDTWLSDVVVGRAVATVAELCFAGQWAVMLQVTANSTGSAAARIASQLLVPFIATAECCSWYAVVTTVNLGHVAENSMWGLSAAMALVAMMANIPRFAPPRRRMLIGWCAAGILYVGFMFLFDVPTYWGRWVVDQAAGRPYLTVLQGLYDVSHRRVVSYRWEDWKTEVVWMSLYFSVAVWISISLIHARLPAVRAEKERADYARAESSVTR